MAAMQRGNMIMGPAARLLLLTYQLDAKDITKITHRRALLKEDVMTHIQAHNLKPRQTFEVAAPRPAPSAAATEAAALAGTPTPAKQKKAPKTTAAPAVARLYTDIPLSNERRQSAERLLSYKFYIPHAYNRVSIRMDSVVNTMQASLKQGGIPVTASDIILKTCAVTLRDIPDANVYFDGENIRHANAIDVSLYCNAKDGLIAPTLRGVDRMAVSNIAQYVEYLKNSIRTNNLKDVDLNGAAFAISNFDSPGLTESTEILQSPQTAILSLGAIFEDLDADLNLIHRSVMTLCYDSRAISDYTASRFLSQLKENLEDSSRMLLGLENSDKLAVNAAQSRGTNYKAMYDWDKFRY